MNFSDFQLDSLLMQAIDKAGYTEPTPIQQAALPVALQGYDIIGTAQTGTGKTAAFVLPILQKLLAGERKKVRGLIVTPTRELALQIDETIRALAKGTGIRSTTIFGGVGAGPQVKALQEGREILVACPGRFLDLAAQKKIKLDALDVLILDEADRMFDMGFLPDVKRILQLVPAKRQTMLFSATFPKEVEALAQQALRKPKRIAVGISRPAHTVAHALYPVPQHLKVKLLYRILELTETGSVLVFTRTKHRAQRISKQLERQKYKATCLHGDRSQGQRQAALAGFKSGKYHIMVATDIAARGLDVEGISHVINLDIPDTEDAYIHRIGRTGRAERTGDAFTMITPDDEPMVKSLEKIMGQTIERKTIADFNYDAEPPSHYQAPSRRGQRQRTEKPAAEKKSEPRTGKKKEGGKMRDDQPWNFRKKRKHDSSKPKKEKGAVNKSRPAGKKKRPAKKENGNQGGGNVHQLW